MRPQGEAKEEPVVRVRAWFRLGRCRSRRRHVGGRCGSIDGDAVGGNERRHARMQRPPSVGQVPSRHSRCLSFGSCRPQTHALQALVHTPPRCPTRVIRGARCSAVIRDDSNANRQRAPAARCGRDASRLARWFCERPHGRRRRSRQRFASRAVTRSGNGCCAPARSRGRALLVREASAGLAATPSAVTPTRAGARVRRSGRGRAGALRRGSPSRRGAAGGNPGTGSRDGAAGTDTNTALGSASLQVLATVQGRGTMGP